MTFQINKKAFPIPKLVTPLALNAAPQTPEQYLSLVQAEAQSLPSILIADTCPSPTPNTSAASTVTKKVSHKRQRPRLHCPTHAIPCPTWRRQVGAFFLELQLTLISSPSSSYSKKHLPSSQSQWLDCFKNKLPALSFLKRLDFITLARGLAVLDDTLPSNGDDFDLCLIQRPCMVLTWMFSILAYMQP